MNHPLLDETQNNLKRNGFTVYICETPHEAKKIFTKNILPEMEIKTASYADSMTLHETRILDEVRNLKGIEFIDTFDKTKSWDEKIELRRRALGVDLFLTGTNAITQKGQLINLDMIGNRINGIVFGPRAVVITVGINKIVKDIEEGMKRIKEISAPRNAIRHTKLNLPCQKGGYCVECSNEQRICNSWSIMEKCFPKKRIKIIIINRELGL